MDVSSACPVCPPPPHPPHTKNPPPPNQRTPLSLQYPLPTLEERDPLSGTPRRRRLSPAHYHLPMAISLTPACTPCLARVSPPLIKPATVIKAVISGVIACNDDEKGTAASHVPANTLHQRRGSKWGPPPKRGGRALHAESRQVEMFFC